MAALPLQLEIQGSGGNFTFLVPPTFEPQTEPVYKTAANPQVIEQLRWTWSFSGALLVSTDGTTATLWTQWLAFLARFQTRGSQPTYARITRDPAGTNTVVWTLGPSTYEQLRFESVRAGRATSAAVAPGVWRVAIPVDLTITATQKLPDNNGIVGWNQSVLITTDEGGLQIVEWRTRITTAEGTDARTKARTYGLIPISVYGDSYSYLTNNDDGVEIEVEDADEQNSRVPTVATGVCRLKQWGVSVGASGPGTSPSTFFYGVRTRIEKDERVITYTARAVGPNARAWVLNRIPAGIAITESETFEEQAGRVFEATWIQRMRSIKGDGRTRVIQVSISGGKVAYDYEVAVGGLEPVEFESGLHPWTVTVAIRIEMQGGEGLNTELLLPASLEEIGLRLDPLASEEGEPFVAKQAETPAAVLWAREARIVYRSARKPTVPQIRTAIEANKAEVASYFLT